MRPLAVALALSVLSVVAPAQNQLDSGAASLGFTGTNCSAVDVCPRSRINRPEAPIRMTASSVVNGPQAWALFHLPGAAAVAPGCLSSPFGIVNLDCTQLTAIETVINGLVPLSWSDLFLGNTGPAGAISLPITIPAGTPQGILGSFQALMVDPPSAAGLTLSCATTMIVPPPIASSMTIGTGANPTMAGDETTFQLVFSTSFAFPFFGTSYTECWVNSNGNITFGGGDITGFQSVGGFTGGAPRIAPYWDDFDASQDAAATVTFTETASSLLVTWNGVPEWILFGQQGSNTFGALLDVGGSITMEWNTMSSTDGLVGLSPGAAGGALPLAIDLSLDSGTSGGPADAIHEEFFSGSNPFDLLFCLSTAGGPSSWVPNAPFTTPGDAGYTYF